MIIKIIMDNIEKKKNLLSELKRLSNLIGNNNWECVRNSKNYLLKKKNYRWGIRNYYQIPKDNYNKYLDMQASRGIDDYKNEGIDFNSPKQRSAYAKAGAILMANEGIDDEQIRKLRDYLMGASPNTQPGLEGVPTVPLQ